MVTSTRLVAVEMVRNGCVWIGFEGRGTNLGGVLGVRFEKHREGNFQLSE